jgi:hypothetical protein
MCGEMVLMVVIESMTVFLRLLMLRTEQQRVNRARLCVPCPTVRIDISGSETVDILILSHYCSIHVARQSRMYPLLSWTGLPLELTIIWQAQVEILEILLPVARVGMAGPR